MKLRWNLSLLTLTLIACEQHGIEERTVAKGIEHVPDSSSLLSEGRSKPTDWPWTLPEAWAEDPEPRQMRLATFIAPDAAGPVEVAVTRFDGRVGGERAIINRWRGQMGLNPISGDEIENAITRYSAAGFEGYETRIESTEGVMLAAGVYEAAIDKTWFVRATVRDTLIADRLESSLFGMARSIAGVGDGGGE